MLSVSNFFSLTSQLRYRSQQIDDEEEKKHIFPDINFSLCIFLFFSSPFFSAALKHSPSKRKSLSKVAHQKSTESEADSHGNYQRQWKCREFSIKFSLSTLDKPSTSPFSFLICRSFQRDTFLVEQHEIAFSPQSSSLLVSTKLSFFLFYPCLLTRQIENSIKFRSFHFLFLCLKKLISCL